jgi:hypothetical protein
MSQCVIRSIEAVDARFALPEGAVYATALTTGNLEAVMEVMGQKDVKTAMK